MHNDACSNRVFPSFSACRILLPLCYFCGMVCGIIFAHCSDSFASLMRRALLAPVSIVGHATVFLLPFLLTAFAVWISHPGILLTTVFGKAFLFGACSAALDLSFGSAGWLVRIFLMFSDMAGLSVFYWLWLRLLTRNHSGILYAFLAAFVALVCIGGIDYRIITPFLASVI